MATGTNAIACAQDCYDLGETNQLISPAKCVSGKVVKETFTNIKLIDDVEDDRLVKYSNLMFEGDGVFEAFDVTDKFRDASLGAYDGIGGIKYTPVGTVIMLHKPSNKYKAFVFDSTIDYEIMGIYRTPSKFNTSDYTLLGLFLYGRNIINDDNNIYLSNSNVVCISLVDISSEGNVYARNTDNFSLGAQLVKDMYDVGLQYSPLESIPKINTTIRTLEPSDLPKSSQTLSIQAIQTTATGAGRYGYSVILNSDFYFKYHTSNNTYNSTGCFKDDNDKYQKRIFAKSLSALGIINTEFMQIIKSPFISDNYLIDEYIVPRMISDVYNSDVITTFDPFIDGDMYLGFPGFDAYDELIDYYKINFPNIEDIHLPTFNEIRMIYARLGLITGVETLLLQQNLIQMCTVNLLYSTPLANQIGNIILSSSRYSGAMLGFQGDRGRLVNAQAGKVNTVEYITIPLITLNATDFYM